MSIIFETYGPFKLPKRKGLIDQSDRKKFWMGVEKKHRGLSKAVGCYIFGIKAGKGVKPWYVGKTEKQTFASETWQASKLNKINKQLNEQKGNAMLYLLARITSERGAFVKKGTERPSIGQLEELLIARCLARNPGLLNRTLTKFAREIVVPGYMNGGQLNKGKSAKELSSLLGMR